jgi:hypothetical protein
MPTVARSMKQKRFVDLCSENYRIGNARLNHPHGSLFGAITYCRRLLGADRHQRASRTRPGLLLVCKMLDTLTSEKTSSTSFGE